jgi:hypothetical protein
MLPVKKYVLLSEVNTGASDGWTDPSPNMKTTPPPAFAKSIDAMKDRIKSEHMIANKPDASFLTVPAP